MRVNLTKKDIVKSIYMQIGFSKKILDVILDDFLNIIIKNLKHKKKVKISNLVLLKLDTKNKDRAGTQKQMR